MQSCSACRVPMNAAVGSSPTGKGTDMNDKSKDNRATSRNKGGYIALAMCAVIAGVVTLTLTSGAGNAKAPQTPRVEQAQTPSVVQEDPVPAAPVIQPEEVELPTEPEDREVLAAPEDFLPQVVSPLDGTTVTVFSMTELMYDETMADWRTHNGVDIQAGEGDAVKTAADGTVRAVTVDELMGVTVLIDHADGYTTQYSSLQEAPPVAEGETVSAGQTIGYVGATAAAESAMGPHLHFSVSLDGKQIDPREYVG